MAAATAAPTGIRRLLQERIGRRALYPTPAYWDERATRLDGLGASLWPNDALNRQYHLEQVSLMEKWLPDVAGAEVLDLGCGTGRVARYLAGRGAKVLGIDFSPNCIAVARSLSDGNPEYRIQDMFELGEEGRFDLAVTWAALAVACRGRSELLSVLTRLRKALKPGGGLLLGEPVHRGFLHRVLDMGFAEYTGLLRSAGIVPLDVAQLHFWPTRLLFASLPWPEGPTRLACAAGRACLALTRQRAFGDYSVVRASLAG